MTETLAGIIRAMTSHSVLATTLNAACLLREAMNSPELYLKDTVLRGCVG
jgi:hypothetical protein